MVGMSCDKDDDSCKKRMGDCEQQEDMKQRMKFESPEELNLRPSTCVGRGEKPDRVGIVLDKDKWKKKKFGPFLEKIGPIEGKKGPFMEKIILPANVQPNCFEFEKERERCETTDLTRPGIPMGVFDHHTEGSKLRRLSRNFICSVVS